MSFITYEKESGKIISFVEAPDDHKDYYITDAIGSIFLDEGVTKTTIKDYYIVDEAFVLRDLQLTSINKTTITADGIDEILITSSPDGIFTAINRHTEEKVSGAIVGDDSFSTTIPGTYQITITSFPYLDFTATIEAT